jgi:hypothetical protein
MPEGSRPEFRFVPKNSPHDAVCAFGLDSKQWAMQQ